MRHPNFSSGPARGSDSDARQVAEQLCDRIKTLWREAGYVITAEVVCVGHHGDGDRNPLWGIRSNLVNGLPSGKPILVRP